MNNELSFMNLLMQENNMNGGCLASNLQYLDESQLFVKIHESGKVTDIVSTINTKLHSPGKDRVKTLLLLEKLLPQCSNETFADYSVGWMQHCCKWNQNSVNHELRILRYLIEHSVSNPDLKKQVITNVLPKFAERLTCLNDSKSTYTIVLKLQCLKSVVYSYSSSCGPYRGSFQKFIMYCLKEYQELKAVVREACTCFVALCQCGSKGQQGINYKEVWSSQFKMLIDTSQKLIDLIYSNVNFVSMVPVVDTDNASPGLLEITPEYEKTPTMRYHGLKVRFAVLTELLQAMLLCRYSVNKIFRQDDIFGLICRVLSVTGSVLQKCVQTNDILSLTANIPELHSCAFDILQAVIICAKRNLIPHGALICKLCVQSLKWTYSSEWKYGSSKPYECLRSKAYAVLSSWLLVSGSCSSAEIFADEIIPLIISDIQFVKPSLKLTVSTKQVSKKNKRKRSRLVTEMDMKSDSILLIDQEANKNVCIEAHRALQNLLHSVSVLIKSEHHKNLQSVILPLLLEIFNCSSTDQYPVPYSNSNCRLELLRSCFTLAIEPHPKWSSPVALVGRVMNMGITDRNTEVSSFCRSATSQLEILIHPRCPTLYFSSHKSKESAATSLKSSDMFMNNEISIPHIESVIAVETEKNITVNKINDLVTDTDEEIRGTVKESNSELIESITDRLESAEIKKLSSNTDGLNENLKSSKVEMLPPVVFDPSPNSLVLETVDHLKSVSEEQLNTINEPSVQLNTINEPSVENLKEISETSEETESSFSLPEASVESIVEVADTIEGMKDSENLSPPYKKLKTDNCEIADDEKVQSMLADFEDTLVESESE